VAGGRRHAHAHHALAGYALTQFDCPITFVSPARHVADGRVQAGAAPYNLIYREAEHVERRSPMPTSSWSSRWCSRLHQVAPDEPASVGMTPANYKITRELLANKAKSDAILLHSLPRMDEIPPTWTSPAGPATGRKPSTACHAHGVIGVGVGEDGGIRWSFAYTCTG
jgi:aspartate carbamoyltransferase catalytic subunit